MITFTRGCRSHLLEVLFTKTTKLALNLNLNLKTNNNIVLQI